MKNFAKLLDESIKEIEAVGIKRGNNIEFIIDNKTKTRWGQTCRKGNGFCISISSELLSDEVPDRACKETIIHEILHTVDLCYNHGKEWKRNAQIMNQTYGYNIKRVDSTLDKGFSEKAIKMMYSNFKYCFVCSKCGVFIGRQRTSAFVKNPEIYFHSSCGGSFKRVK